MKNDKKLNTLNMAVQNLKAKKFRTAFMMFFVVLMSATVFFSTILMNNLKQGIKSTTERAGADVIVVPDEGTEDIRDSLFAGTPCSVFFDKSWKDAVEKVEGVKKVSAQMYVGTLSASCCDLPVQMIAFDPETDFVVQPWLKNQNTVKLKKGQVLVGDRVAAEPGDTLQFYMTEFEVAGKLEKTGMGYDGSVFMTFETLYELKSSETAKAALPMDDIEDKVSMLMVDIDDSIRELDLIHLRLAIAKCGPEGEKMYAGSMDELLNGISVQVKKLSGYGNVLTYISLISTALALISIFILTINERRYEFGVLYALGAKKSQMRNIILSEALIISGIGGAAGTLLTYGLVAAFKDIISIKLDVPYLDMSMGQTMPVAGICIVIALATGMIAAVCSACQISKGEIYRLLKGE
ncbi:MAG: ABC transporter permease [Lachnospiraceae bacterium]